MQIPSFNYRASQSKDSFAYSKEHPNVKRTKSSKGILQKEKDVRIALEKEKTKKQADFQKVHQRTLLHIEELSKKRIGLTTDHSVTDRSSSCGSKQSPPTNLGPLKRSSTYESVRTTINTALPISTELTFPSSPTEDLISGVGDRIESFMKGRELTSFSNQDSLIENLQRILRFKILDGENDPKTVAVLCRNFTDSILLMLDHFCTDSSEISHHFFRSETPLKLQTVEYTDSDPHNSGKRVYILSFVLEDGRKLVYKPRSVESDSWVIGSPLPGQDLSLFAKANQFFNQENTDQKLLLPTVKFLEKEDYAYSEFISQKFDNSNILRSDHIFTRIEADRYYQNLGRIETIARVFGIGDLHGGNVIIHDKMPVLIDLEVILNPKIIQPNSGNKYEETCLGLAMTQFFGDKNVFYEIEDSVQPPTIRDPRVGGKIPKDHRDAFLIGVNDAIRFLQQLKAEDVNFPSTVHSRKIMVDTVSLKKLRGRVLKVTSLEEKNKFIRETYSSVFERENIPEGQQDILVSEVLAQLQQGDIPIHYFSENEHQHAIRLATDKLKSIQTDPAEFRRNLQLWINKPQLWINKLKKEVTVESEEV